MNVRRMLGAGEARLTRLCLVADDLTGALDTAAQFVSVFGSIGVHWGAAAALSSIAYATGAREGSGAAAAALVSERLARTSFDPAVLYYAKLDTLLRGHPADE